MPLVSLNDGKYEFELDDSGLLVAARRHGVEWPAGLELRFTRCFVSALSRIAELETELAALRSVDMAYPVEPDENRCTKAVYPGHDPENGPAERCRLAIGHDGKHKTRLDA